MAEPMTVRLQPDAGPQQLGREPAEVLGARIPRWTAPGAAPQDATAEREVALPRSLTADLSSLAADCDTSLEVVLAAAHVKILSVVTGAREVVTGYAAAGAGPSGTPPLRQCRIVVADGTWRRLLAAVSGALAQPASGNGGGPARYEAVLDLSALRAAGDPGGSAGTGGWDALHVACHMRGEQLVARLRYRLGVLDHDQAERLAGYYQTALRLMAGDPDQPHEQHSLLSALELRHQLYGLAGPAEPLADESFVEAFEQQVRARPDDCAAEHHGERWSYRRLNEAANHVAHVLLGTGLEPEDVVGVATERNLDWLAALLGVLKAQGVYLPIRPDFPAGRIATQLAGSDCRVVLTDGRRTTNVDAALGGLEHGITVLRIQEAYRAASVPGNPQVAIGRDQLAYIYFTSGSTGTPKGAMCEHAGMLNHLRAKIDDLELAAGDVVAQTASQCFDISLWQLLAPLLVGGSTWIVDDDVLMDAARFVEDVASRGVHVAQVVPSYLEVLVGYLEDHPRDLGRLRALSVTGEALKLDLVQRWFALCPDVKLVNAYGATEVSDDTMHEVLEGVPARDFVTVGRPLRNVYTYVLDERLRLVPLGSPGEIAFAGVSVGRGYVNDGQRTRQVFVADPYRLGTRMYRTGDYGRWLPEGKIEFLGRLDEQVKVRGFRIEMGEIEAQLLAVPAVGAAAVVLDGAQAASMKLVAFYTEPDRGNGPPDPGPDPVAAQDLRDHLAGVLPEYMVPAYFHRLDLLPLNENGKVDKVRLRELAGTLGHGGGRYAAPATANEQLVANAWAEVLHVPLQRIGRDSSFFDLGGTSLTAVRLVVKLDRAVSLQQVSRFPVLSELAACIDGPEPDGDGPAASAADLLQPLGEANRTPVATLVCVPYAGGNAINFQGLAAELDRSGIAVEAVELPGHDLSPGNGELAGVEEVARRVRDELRQRVAAPVLLWGHGSGSAVALETARLLAEDGGDVRGVFLGAALLREAAELEAEIDAVSALSDRDVTARMSAHDAYVELDDLRPERARVVGSAYRHDVRCANHYLAGVRQDPGGYRLRCPLTVVVAADDESVAGFATRYRQWELLAGDVRLTELPAGGQHFLRTRPANAAAAVVETLAGAPADGAAPAPALLTGRIDGGPHEAIVGEILEPQLHFERARLLEWYVRIEKVLLLEYRRMGMLTGGEVAAIASSLEGITSEAVAAHSLECMTDMAFTIERLVAEDLAGLPPAWHVDRSRNDLQAAAQMLYGRERILEVAESLLGLAGALHATAERTTAPVMPGCTHMQPAQVVTPAFYLTAISEQVLHTLDRLDAAYRSASACPLGAGAMAGQELPWDRERMAGLLGCEGVGAHALRAVAARDWSLEALAEFSLLGVTLSRFVTDLLLWSSAAYRFVDLPDAWSGISSAMPQKKNFPVLERIRGRTAHLATAYGGALAVHSATPYGNTVEVSKEAGRYVEEAFDTMASILRLLSGVVEGLRFSAPEMLAACEREHLGAFTLANLLALRERVPWRTAQVVAGKYVVAAQEQGRQPGSPDPDLLARLAGEHGSRVEDAANLLAEAFDLDGATSVKKTPGSAHPEAVRRMLEDQREQRDRLSASWKGCRERVRAGLATLERLVAECGRAGRGG